jgi:phage tail sheath protein FI
MVMRVDDAGAFAAAVKVTVAEHVGLHGLLLNADAVTPLGRTVRILKVTGDVVALAFNVAVAVSIPPAAPSVIDSVDGLAARVKSKNPETTRVNEAVWVTPPPVACMVIDVEEAGAFAAALKVIVELQVGLQGLLRKIAVTPVGSVVRILNVTGVVVPDVKVAVAVSEPPAAPSVIVSDAGETANVKLNPGCTTSVNVAV